MKTAREVIGEWGEVYRWDGGDCKTEALADADALLIELNKAGYMIVPVKPTEKMIEELARIGDGPQISGEEVWGYMLGAATDVS